MTMRLTRFVLASTVLHGAVLLVASSPAAWLAGHAQTVLSVYLTAPDEGARPLLARAEERPHAAVTRDRTHAQRPGTVAPARSGTPAEADEPGQAIQRDVPSADSVPEGAFTVASAGDTALEQVRAKIRARLRTHLARHFEYPYAARLRGWEGEVLLAFRIESDGRLEDIRVARGSGFAVLDDSALNSLARVGRLEEARAWLDGNRLDMQLAVVYRLHE